MIHIDYIYSPLSPTNSSWIIPQIYVSLFQFHSLSHFLNWSPINAAHALMVSGYWEEPVPP